MDQDGTFLGGWWVQDVSCCRWAVSCESPQSCWLLAPTASLTHCLVAPSLLTEEC